MAPDAGTTSSGHAHELAGIIRGMSVALLGSVLGGGLGFFFGVAMARLVDQRSFGLIVLAVNILGACAAMTIAGADYTAIRHVAAALSPGAKRGAMRTPVRLAMTLNLVVAACLALAARPISVHVLHQPGFTTLLRLVALTLPLTVLAQLFSACLSGLERASGELVRKVVEQGGRIALGAALVAGGFGVAGAGVGLAIAAAAAAVAVGLLLWRLHPRGGITEPLAARRVIGFAWPQAVGNVANQVCAVAVVVILARSVDARTVGLFGAAYAVSQLPLLVYNAFTYRFSPAIARLWDRGEREPLEALLRSVTRWVALVALPLHAVAIALPGPLLQIYGSRYRGAALALALMTIASLLNALAGPVDRTLIMTGRVKLEMATNVGSMVLVIGLAAILAPRYGLLGAATSMLVYTVVMNTTKTLFVRSSLQMTAPSFELLRLVAAAAVASGVAVAANAATSLGASLPGTALLALLLVATYALMLVYVVRISPGDRRALLLAVRPSSAPTLG